MTRHNLLLVDRARKRLKEERSAFESGASESSNDMDDFFSRLVGNMTPHDFGVADGG